MNPSLYDSPSVAPPEQDRDDSPARAAGESPSNVDPVGEDSDSSESAETYAVPGCAVVQEDGGHSEPDPVGDMARMMLRGMQGMLKTEIGAELGKAADVQNRLAEWRAGMRHYGIEERKT